MAMANMRERVLRCGGVEVRCASCEKTELIIAAVGRRNGSTAREAGHAHPTTKGESQVLKEVERLDEKVAVEATSKDLLGRNERRGSRAGKGHGVGRGKSEILGSARR